MLVNWKIEYCTTPPANKQPPDYYISDVPYWFFRYFDVKPQVDVVDIKSFKWLENFEKNKIRFYIWQTLKILPKLHQYDLILSHGMQSGIVLAFFRRFFHTKAKHIVFDIGSFNSAKEKGTSVKFMQFSSKSIDGLIYHTSKQKEFYTKVYPWLLDKSRFICFGTDCEFFHEADVVPYSEEDYILCVGSIKRDWDTLLKAYENIETNTQLWLLGNSDLISSDRRVKIIPHVDVKEMKSMIKSAKFCVLPLEYANYSFGQMTLLQQMLMKKAIITADAPSVADYIRNGKTALVYKAQDVDELKNNIETLLADDSLRNELAQNAVISVKEKYDEKTMAKNIEQFITCL